MALVSYYPNSFEIDNGNDVELNKILQGIRHGKWKELVEKVRSSEDQLEKDKLKKNAPVFIPTGTFKKDRKDESCKQPTFLACLDLDQNLPHYKQVIQEDPYTAVAFKSISNKGYAVLVKIDPGVKDKNDHKDIVRALITYYKEKYQIEIDPTCKNRARLRIVSYDPELIAKKDSQVWFKREEVKKAPVGEYKDSKVPIPIAIEKTRKMYEKGAGDFGSKGSRHDWVYGMLVWLNRSGIPYNDALSYCNQEFVIRERDYLAEHKRSADHIYTESAAEFGTKRQPRYYTVEDLRKWPEYKKEILEWFVQKEIERLEKYHANTTNPSKIYVEIQEKNIEFLAELWKHV